MKSEILSNLSFLPKIILTEIKLNYKLYLTNQTPIIIYQMGKVGSTSVNRSLQQSGINSVFQVHHLSKPLENRNFFDKNSLQSPSVKIRKILGIKTGAFLYDNVIRKRKPVKIISLTREPIGRNIAGFFENFERETGKKYEDSNFTPQELVEIFLTSYPHSIPLNWFDDHLKARVGIDVYDYAFPKEEGWLSIQKDNVDLLLLKSELPDAIKEKRIAEFLKLKDFKIVNKNVGNDKDYRNTYQIFKKTLRLPLDYVEEMCTSKYFNHFYTHDEIQQVRSTWSE